MTSKQSKIRNRLGAPRGTLSTLPNSAAAKLSKLDQPNNLIIEMVSPADLRPNSQNPRMHSKQQLRALQRNIQKNGFTNPILVGRDNEIIAGHGRHAASLLANLPEVPIIRLKLSVAEAKAYAVWDNRSGDLSAFDDRLLSLALTELIDLDFDIQETGFSVAEADLLLDICSATAAEDDLPEKTPVFDRPSVSRAGYIWICGKHRIACGDARDSVTYQSLMQRSKAHMAFTDVPYNVAANKISGKGAIRHPSFKMAAGEMTSDEYRQFLREAMAPMCRYSVDGSLHYHCIDWRHIADLQDAASSGYASLLNLCIWAKTNAGMGSFYRSQHELVFVYKNGRKPHRNNIELGRYGRNRTNLWQYAGGTSPSGRSTDEGNLLALHPTVKPVQMVADAILDCTARSEIVLDPFLGSGSTLIAAERTGRICRGIEIDPLYVDAAIRRWQFHTGQKAKLASTGANFDDLC